LVSPQDARDEANYKEGELDLLSRKRRRGPEDDTEYQPPGHRRVSLIMISSSILSCRPNFPLESMLLGGIRHVQSISDPNHLSPTNQTSRSKIMVGLRRRICDLFHPTSTTARKFGLASWAIIFWRHKSAKIKWKNGLKPVFS
jgi:hypothetical protein